MKLTKEERMRRLLVRYYNEVIARQNPAGDLGLLDALQDCVNNNGGDEQWEWTVSPLGKVRFL